MCVKKGGQARQGAAVAVGRRSRRVAESNLRVPLRVPLVVASGFGPLGL